MNEVAAEAYTSISSTAVLYTSKMAVKCSVDSSLCRPPQINCTLLVPGFNSHNCRGGRKFSYYQFMIIGKEDQLFLNCEEVDEDVSLNLILHLRYIQILRSERKYIYIYICLKEKII